MPLIKTIDSQLSKNTQSIEIALRTIKNEAEIKRARIGEILAPKFQIKSPVNGPDFPSRGIFFVSKWILLRVGELTSLVEFFWFLFLVFQCYRTVAYLL